MYLYLFFLTSFSLLLANLQYVYRAPEVIRGDTSLCWRAVDVWALGIILYSMIFHQFPPWNRKVDPQSGQIATVATDINDRTFHIVCRHGRLGELLSKNGINVPEDVVDLL